MDENPRSREEAKEHINSIRRKRGFSDDGKTRSADFNLEDLEASVSMYCALSSMSLSGR